METKQNKTNKTNIPAALNMINTYTLALAVQYSNQELKEPKALPSLNRCRKKIKKKKSRDKKQKWERMPWRDKSSINIQEEYIMLCQAGETTETSVTWRTCEQSTSL